MKIELTVNGLNVQAQYPDDEIENVHKPLLRKLAALQTDGKSAAANRGFSLRSAGNGKIDPDHLLGISRATRPGTTRYSDAPDGWLSPLQ